MGIQPATLQSGLITGAPSTDHTAPTPHHLARSGATLTPGQTVTITGTAADVGGVVSRASRSRPTTARAGTRRRATRTGATPGRRRSPAPTRSSPAPSTTASIWRRLRPGAPSRSGRRTTSPCSPVRPIRDREHDRCQRRRTRREVHELGRRHGQRHPFLQEHARTPAPTPVRCGRAPARSSRALTFANETASGWQTATFSSPVAIAARRRPTPPPITPMSATIPTPQTTSRRTS